MHALPSKLTYVAEGMMERGRLDLKLEWIGKLEANEMMPQLQVEAAYGVVIAVFLPTKLASFSRGDGQGQSSHSRSSDAKIWPEAKLRELPWAGEGGEDVSP